MTRRHLAAAMRAAALAWSVAAGAPACAACEDVLPAAAPTAPTAPRAVRADDLLRLRDIGQPDGALVNQPSPLALSPDGRTLAFVITRANPETNGHCRALVTIDTAGRDGPRALDRGGDLITTVVASRGVLIDNGFPAAGGPVWSPDGRWIAYLRRDHGVTQVWRARADGGGAAQVTRSTVDSLAVSWRSDGMLAVLALDGVPAVDAAIDREGRQGWLYDARVVPNIAARPRRPDGLARTVTIVDPATGRSMPGSASDRTLIRFADPSAASAPPAATAPDGRRAWTEHDTASPLSPLKLIADAGALGPVTCASPMCRGAITGLWWAAEGRSVVFLRREGWADGAMALYRWTPGNAEPRVILRTNQMLIGCLPAAGRLLCLAEASALPRRIVAIDLRSGRSTPIFDPNPEFAALRLGRVQRLEWRNDRGLAAWGDLVLPPGHRRGDPKLPMVVVQYHSDGFLRGGIGDEYPVFAFAARGVAVLSLENPAFVAKASGDVRSFDDVNRVNARDWAERRSLLSSIETGVKRAIATGAIDPARIGITGLSDGASSARFALVNTRLFAAASLSSCCVDTRSVMTYGGIALADSFRKIGWPPASADDRDFWRPYSLTVNARDMRTPLLMQLSDDEYLHALETFTALRENRQQVEMHVFPGEHHIKWQPAHRQAIYERNLDWFDYWLRDHRDPDQAKAPQYARWDTLRRSGAP